MDAHNPYAPPTATVADTSASAGPRRMPKRVRALQGVFVVFAGIVGLSVVRMAGWVIQRYDDAAISTLLALAWQSAVCVCAIAVVVALQRRTRFARGLAQGLIMYMLATMAVVALYRLADPNDNGYALFFAVGLVGLWYASCWSKKARAFFAS